jgi:hypothetical protein
MSLVVKKIPIGPTPQEMVEEEEKEEKPQSPPTKTEEQTSEIDAIVDNLPKKYQLRARELLLRNDFNYNDSGEIVWDDGETGSSIHDLLELYFDRKKREISGEPYDFDRFVLVVKKTKSTKSRKKKKSVDMNVKWLNYLD